MPRACLAGSGLVGLDGMVQEEGCAAFGGGAEDGGAVIGAAEERYALAGQGESAVGEVRLGLARRHGLWRRWIRVRG